MTTSACCPAESRHLHQLLEHPHPELFEPGGLSMKRCLGEIVEGRSPPEREGRFEICRRSVRVARRSRPHARSVGRPLCGAPTRSPARCDAPSRAGRRATAHQPAGPATRRGSARRGVWPVRTAASVRPAMVRPWRRLARRTRSRDDPQRAEQFEPHAAMVRVGLELFGRTVGTPVVSVSHRQIISENDRRLIGTSLACLLRRLDPGSIRSERSPDRAASR